MKANELTISNRSITKTTDYNGRHNDVFGREMPTETDMLQAHSKAE
jgi:hypothetical protein